MATVFVDQITGNGETVAYKAPCRVATTANIDLSGLQTVDGIAVAVDDRILVKDQSDARQNGIYIAATGPWQRSRDFNSNRDVTRGTKISVNEGTAANREFSLTSANPISVGTSVITFAFADDVQAASDYADAAEASADRAEAAATAVGSVVTLQGTWDASTGSFPAGTIKKGYGYIVTADGVVDGVDFTANPADMVVAIKDNPSMSTYAGNWLKFDFSNLVKSVAGLTGIISASALKAALTLVVADIAGAVAKNADGQLAAGYTAASVDDGTKSSGTYTPSPAGGNFRKIVANGAFTLTAPTATGCYSMTIDITNGASAGAITFTGFATGHPRGDTIGAANGAKYKMHISKTDAGVTAAIEAL